MRSSSDDRKRAYCAPLRRLVLVLAAILVASCSVKLVEDYDPVIDEGITAYTDAIGAHLRKVEALSLSYADSGDFYFEQAAKLDTLLIRARAGDDSGICDLTGGIDRQLQNVLDTAKSLDPGLDMSAYAIDRSQGTGNCTVIALRVIQANHGIIDALHRKGKLNPVVTPIVRDSILQSARIATQNELAKKARGVGGIF